MSIGFVQAVWTVIAFVFFVGIVIWAWSDNRKADFERAARMALDDDEPLPGAGHNFGHGSGYDSGAEQDNEVRGHHG